MKSWAIIFACVMAALASGCAGTANTDADDKILVQSAAATEKAENVQTTPTDPDDPDALRCKKIKQIGTRISREVCATNRAWKKSEIEGQKATETLQRRPQHRKDGG